MTPNTLATAGAATVPLKMHLLGCDTVTSLAIGPPFPFLKIRRQPRIL